MGNSLRGLFVVLLCVAAAGARWAMAQSPYAGSWSGTLTFTATTSCTGSAGPSTFTCTGSTPWSGTVDAQGGFTYSNGVGSATCDLGPPTTIPASPPSLLGQIPANGTLSLPASTSSVSQPPCTSSATCNAYSIQFTLSPSRVTSTSVCNSTATCSDGTNASTCTTSAQSVLNGSGGGGGAQVFPIRVTSNITPTTASASAEISPPSQLVGTSGSVFVFAHARQSALTSASATAGPGTDAKNGTGPDPCVLAQLDSSGRLRSATPSTMQAYTSGVLSSQTQAVTILNNVPTPNVAGASFLVGYGSSASAMISSGLYQGAVSVTGTSGCSAALLAGAAPASPSALSGLWWNPNESGWGISFTQRRNIVFGAWYTYDSAGRPKWYVASSCAMPSGVTGTTGTCNGTLYQVTGPTFFGSQFNPSLAQVAAVGSLQVSFTGPNSATMTYTVNGQSRTVPIERQTLQSGSNPPAVDYTDLWWNASESGWGMVITQQYGVIFIAWYVYDNSGNPVWYVAPNCPVVGSSCTGAVYSTTGPPLGPTFNPSAVQATAVGTISVTFSDANNASVSYTIGGTSGTKTITRQTF